MKVYLLVSDKCPSYHGAEFYLLGTFSNKEDAEFLRKNMRGYTKVIESEVDTLEDPKYIGGYFRIGGFTRYEPV